MSVPPETQTILNTFATNLTLFAHNVEIINQGNTRAVQDLSRSVAQLVETTSTSIAHTHEQLGAVAIALQHPLNNNAPELQQLVQTLTQLPPALQQDQPQLRPALKLDPPT